MTTDPDAVDTADDPPAPPMAGSAFLLAQLGAHAAARFAERISSVGLTPAHSGLLRLVAQAPGRSQHALATQLGIAPSKVVALVDRLEARGLIERRRSSTDRRNYALHLSERGRSTLAEIATVAAAHEADLTSALTDDEHRQLTGLLQRIADHQGLTRGVHPGYRKLRPSGSCDGDTRPA